MQFGALTLAQWAAALSPAENTAPQAPAPEAGSVEEEAPRPSEQIPSAKNESPKPNGVVRKTHVEPYTTEIPNGFHTTPSSTAVETSVGILTPPPVSSTLEKTPSANLAVAATSHDAPGEVLAPLKTETSKQSDIPAKPAVPLSWAARVAKNVPRTKSTVATSSPVAPAAPPVRSVPLPPLPDRRVRGLVNGGNTCFINVILQALIACDPFRRFLLSCRNVKSVPPLLEKFVTLASDMTVAAKIVSEPASAAPSAKRLPNLAEPLLPDWCHDIFPSSMPNSNSTQRPVANGGSSNGRRGGSQEDAQEFLTFLLNQLHEELLASESHGAEVKGNGFVSHEARENVRQDANRSLGGIEKGGGEWQEMNRRGRPVHVRGSSASQSAITRIFGGSLRSELKRPRAKTSITREPFLSLSLDIDSGMIRHVEDALGAYFQMEHVEGYTAEDSQEAVEAKKQVLLETLPPVLILHLKRFSHDSRTGALNKVGRRLDFPESLSIPASIFHGSKSTQSVIERSYRLTSVVTHIGKELAGGHYLCDVRLGNSAKQVWAACDDSKVSAVNVQNVLRRQAYLLFYTRSCVGD